MIYKCTKCYQAMLQYVHDLIDHDGSISKATTSLCKDCDKDVITFVQTPKTADEITEFWRVRHKLEKKRLAKLRS